MRVAVLIPWLALGLLSNAPLVAGQAEAVQEPEALVDDPRLPLPDLSGLEDVVREQLREGHAAAAQAIGAAGATPEARGEALGKLGQLYYAYDLLEAGGVCFREARRESPGDFRWVYYEATLRQKAGEADAALGLFEKALALRPGDAATLIHIGELELEAGRLEAADSRLREALEVAPGSAAAMARLGQVALARSDHRAAVDWLEAALERVPQANRLHYSLALAYRGLGEQDEARAHLEQRGMIGVAVPDPLLDELRELREGARVELLRGRRAFAAGDHEAAREAFARAVAAEPQNSSARVNLAAVLAELGRVDEAVEELRTALALDSSDIPAHFNLGLLLALRGDGAGAIHHLRWVVSSAPDDEAARLELARVLSSAGLAEEALEHYARVARDDPSSFEARLGEAGALISLGRLREALERLEGAHALDPTSGPIAHALARLLAASPELALRDGARALDLAQRVFEARNSVEHAETVALALAELGRCSEAARWQGEALEAARPGGEEARLAAMGRLRDQFAGGPPCRPGSPQP